jgi:protein PhnA
MSKGADKHQARLNELNSFGKDLARRSKSHCELCDQHGVKLFIHEVPPVPSDPELEHCLFICETCQEQINYPKRLDINHWHCLHSSIWSVVPAAQVMATLMAKLIAPKAPFAEELLDQIYLEEPIQTLIEDAEKALAKK